MPWPPPVARTVARSSFGAPENWFEMPKAPDALSAVTSTSWSTALENSLLTPTAKSESATARITPPKTRAPEPAPLTMPSAIEAPRANARTLRSVGAPPSLRMPPAKRSLLASATTFTSSPFDAALKTA